MQKLKIFMNFPNYYCINNKHIFIDFNQYNLRYLKELHPTNIRKIHVFITSHLSLNSSLIDMIDTFGRFRPNSNCKRMARIIIHIPRKMKHLKSFAKEFLSIQDKKFLLIVEVYGTDFNINSKVETAESLISLFSKPRECLLSIKFTDLSIQVEVKDTKKFLSPVSIKFIEYPYDDNSNNDSIFENEEMRLNPEDFKDKLIESFKTRCPNKILNSFKSDEDIWNYILQKGEWSIKKGGV